MIFIQTGERLMYTHFDGLACNRHITKYQIYNLIDVITDYNNSIGKKIICTFQPNHYFI